MKLLILIILVALCLAFCGSLEQTSLGKSETCDAPQTVYGRVTLNGRGVRAMIDLAQDTMDVRSTQTNAFGYYRFHEVGPCLQYALVVRSKHAGTFPIARIAVHDRPVEVNIEGTR